MMLEERFGKLSSQIREQVDQLSAPQLEALGKSLLSFRALKELTRWLQKNAGLVDSFNFGSHRTDLVVDDCWCIQKKFVQVPGIRGFSCFP